MDEVQVFKREFYTYIHLDYVRIKFLSYIYIKFAQRNEYIFIDQDWCNASELWTAIYLLACVHTWTYTYFLRGHIIFIKKI